VKFFQGFLAGVYASDMDAPERRLSARVAAEIHGLPDDYVGHVRGSAQGRHAPSRWPPRSRPHVKANNLVITLVATADEVLPLLVKSGVAETAIDVVKYDSY
jgi:hypothetical protein